MIEFKAINFRVGSKLILEDINLMIGDGEFVAVIGPNGAGKSTLIKILLGLREASSGAVFLDGIPHHAWLKQNSIGYLPQREEYDPSFPASALDLVLLGLVAQLRFGQRFSKPHKQQALDAMEQTGTSHLARQSIGTLSGGEFQRVLLARAIACKSKYLILDEPEASLDRAGVQSFFALLKQLNEQGRTVITISHDLHTLTDYCSFLVCLNQRLHCHTKTELLSSEIIHKTFGESVHLIEKDY